MSSKNNSTLLDQFKDLLARSKDWATLELEYAKLTAAEKLTMLAGLACTGAVCLLFGITALIMFGISLAFLFKEIMGFALSFLAAGGCVLVLLAIIYFLREKIIINPIARIITKILLK
ncbi:MAG: hypothetical protein K2L22_09440 [Muribaculaceae bacterium]|nr:hypothetical protein [Muribaculaceae bacterium]